MSLVCHANKFARRRLIRAVEHTNILEQSMSRGPYPILLMLAMSLPGAVRALGLGEIRVDSALNEPLSAQIDIVGATRDELIALTAKVPNRDIFQRYGAERPSFLSSATFKVGLDAQGRPVLNVRSAEAFTDPVINFLVELRWANGALVRDYSLLLDPAGFSPAERATAAANASAGARMNDRAAAPAIASPAALPVAALPVASLPPAAASNAAASPALAAPPSIARDTAPSAQRTASHHRVTAPDTLRGIARRAGARSEAPAQRLMIAIFRANPHAFDGNINRLHHGALLTIPSAAEVAALDTADARREYRAQMTAWRLSGRPAHRVAAAPVTAPVEGAAAARVNASAPSSARALSAALALVTAPASAASAAPTLQANKEPDGSAATTVLTNRVHSLEQALDGMHQQLDQLATRTAAAQARPAAQAGPAPAPAVPSPRVEIMRAPAQPAPVLAATAPPQPTGGKWILAPMAAALALLLAGFAYVRRGIVRSRSRSNEAPAIEANGNSFNVALDEPSAAAQREPARLDAVAVSRPAFVETPKQAAPVPAKPDAHAILDPPESDQTTQSLAIDAEALERSYLDLGVDALGIDTVVLSDSAAHDVSTDDTAAHNMATLENAEEDTATLDKSMLETVVLDRAEFGTVGSQAGSGAELVETKKLETVAVNSTVLDYNLLDLDATVQHVQMPSQLNDHVVVTERRTNIVDVLKAAIDRDPHRRDLRMKLLETYYSSAATNQRAFMDVVRQAAGERDFLSADDWQKVMRMGREIAGGDALFADQPKDDELANCA
jgi:FimV-like protein